MQNTRGAIRLGCHAKKDWVKITSDVGKHKKVKEEDRVKIFYWVREHQNVVNSPNEKDAIIFTTPHLKILLGLQGKTSCYYSAQLENSTMI